MESGWVEEIMFDSVIFKCFEKVLEVNTYPMVRAFTAIGFGGDDFVHAMVVAVDSVVQHPILEEQVSQKLSSKGRYISVNIGPIHVRSTEQEQSLLKMMIGSIWWKLEAMRMRYFAFQQSTHQSLVVQ